MKFVGILLAALLSVGTVAARAADCVEDVKLIGSEALAAFALDKGMVIGGGEAAGVVAEIAAEVCSRVASSDAVPPGAVGEIVVIYFGDALDGGQPVLVAALVAEVVEGKSGLARNDRRNFGALAVACAPPSEATVHIGSDISGHCGDRFLVPAGAPVVAVETSASRICETAVPLSTGRSVACECETASGVLACK
ncbi:MAG: hypothetical protein EOS10_24650 [Mesorhizobium sp.]|uniref:hypothetical protein n=1 Tax=Mesorhizobium sp. TaxID=1871066 RepID=UPI000FE783C4|nr:hypothetical protein [Mesorhizobium sp.]RWO28629.1 MAG: hypothetical protein EOS10_24650 [Mesorhizobium sp.]